MRIQKHKLIYILSHIQADMHLTYKVLSNLSEAIHFGNVTRAGDRIYSVLNGEVSYYLLYLAPHTTTSTAFVMTTTTTFAVSLMLGNIKKTMAVSV